MNDPVVFTMQKKRKPDYELAIDLILTAMFLYYLAHPDVFDKLKEAKQRCWEQIVHKVSVWTTKQDIQSLPETDE